MKIERGVLGIATMSVVALAFVAGCGSSTKSGTGGASGSSAGGSSAGGSGAGGKATGGATGTGGQVADGGVDAPKDAPADTGTDTPPRPVCGPFADGGMPSDAGVDASANASFFVTSDTSMTADLGGLAGADMRCQRLATAVGLGGKTWHAYLSVEHGSNGDGGMGPVNAKDRIGAGPWYNVRGLLVAQNLTSLHMRKGDPTIFIDEHGGMINGQWTGSPTPNQHDILTGTNADGTLAAGKTCSDWTSSVGPPDGGVPDGGAADGGYFVARIGHTDGFGGNCTTAPAPPNDVSSWNSAHDNAGCNDTAPRGGAGRLYCFATGP
jgi:hypothetical protein